MEQNSWYREPLGDYLEQFHGENHTTATEKGHAKALTNWHRVTDLLAPETKDDKFKNGLSLSQYRSFQLLREWWEGTIQEKPLTEAAKAAIYKAGLPQNSDSDYLEVDRDTARLTESRYHKEMFMLFQLEFLHEMRLLQTKEIETFKGFVQAQRERCAQYAALQRVAHSFIEHDLMQQGNATAERPPMDQGSKNGLAMILETSLLPACIESCPWLKIQDGRQGLPFFLWDVSERRTIETQTLDKFPSYTCVSHTWGRWLKSDMSPASVSGVPWRVPQNSRFSVSDLPSELLDTFKTGYVWFDLLCIPQDGSERASIEISRQASIFGNARSVIAWLNDATSWSGLRTVAKWLSLFYLKTSRAVENGCYNVVDLDGENDQFLDDAIELYIWEPENPSESMIADEGHEDIASPVGWFSSLWTLQEACLRPDMILCNRSWEVLTTGSTQPIPLDHLVALNNYLARGTYKRDVPSYCAVNISDFETDEIPGCQDLSTLLTDTCMSDLNWVSAGAVFTFGQLRKCTKSRAEAIMSVIGATNWYTSYVSEYGTAPPEDNLVLGCYPAAFLNEALRQIGPTFFTAIPTDLRYLSSSVDLSDGKWNLLHDWTQTGTLLPFTASPTYLVPPQKYSFGAFNHPAVQDWIILDDGSLKVTHAGILDQIHLTDPADGEQDMLIVPIPDQNGCITQESEIETIDGSLKAWLETFSNPKQRPNYAVCLYQQVYLNQDIPGPQVGLLLKEVGTIGSMSALVKVGQYFTKTSRAWEVDMIPVNWIVL